MTDSGRIQRRPDQREAHRWLRPRQAAARLISQAQRDGDLPAHLDAAALAALLVAATDGLKDLSDILDPPSRARRGFEQRMRHLTELVETLMVRR
jgi:hypothetical protein